ncbi:electron transfer flavoprotein subunit alpha/FixB family protein [Opitutus sp. ER46]|uniref:electron transfer flavoprotein subunit alpha/FixB family protein n=1 Tax=Opitutus sp. ER46 TaxID=2161864 RepID=UPI000D31AB90|nr:electron transfer flavoprotein subunit alpha/FixB family protein [Opitutus sp. ER46]PTX91206.1 electron transfer flavoprotein subunit alpha [Opitutus sp. ER46]
MNLLIVAEISRGQLKLATGAAIGFARQVCAAGAHTFDVLLLGSDVGGLVPSVASYGASAVLIAAAPALAEPLADRYADVIAQVARERNTSVVVAAASTFSKDVLPRAAALLDAGMLSDVIGVDASAEEPVFRRVMHAGNVVATVRLAGAVKVLTVRSSAFPTPEKSSATSPAVPVTIDVAALPSGIEFISREEKGAGRPDPTEARIVVSGGRALKNAEDFERLVGGLADTLGAAVGSSRALVDAGITSNALQIGQTGKVVAPELYLAVGISGAIQHVAGMKDAKVIAAINKDPDAPIFAVADYGLVADVYEAVPQIISRLKH